MEIKGNIKEKEYFGINKNVFLLSIVSFITDVSSEMIMPILPMFISSLGGSSVIIGLVGGLRDSIASILKVISGYYSDRTGKKKIFVLLGYFTSSIFKLLLSFSKTWLGILSFAVLERVGKGIRTAPRDAIIADSTVGKRGKGFGIHRAFDTLGAIIGSITVFILYWFLKYGFNEIIFIAAIISFFAVIPIYFVKEPKSNKSYLSLRLSLKSLSKPLKLFILVSAIFTLANFSYMFFILRAQEYFVGKLSVGIPILLYVLFNIFYASFAIPFGILSDKIGRKKVIISGYFLYGLTSFGFAYLHSLSWFIVLFALYGISYAIIQGNQRAYVSDLSSGNIRGTALGTFHTVIGLASLPSSLIAGCLWQINPSITFIYGGILAFISAVIFISYIFKYKL
ncbi:MFS transporter [Methanothermococcus okinawensis]|uniref:Major facilitator superfamily MFS_1 n=1 Tax=Methanothermococcus okinawensis (strain DSM 14208 / JCM 11175 / IH1) TaxID=647113 RepID=F8ALL5_METOI|nr:MFS transporter [Methanothermococcus okinawensis]AEH07291.1 major facilitator superfamily MFS_1 [Methanothermococcus okinawensis IH1]